MFLVRYTGPQCGVCYSRLHPNLSQVVEELRQVGLKQPLELQAQRQYTLQEHTRNHIKYTHEDRRRVWMLTFSKHKILPRGGRKWSAVWRSIGCTFPWIRCTVWKAHCTRNTKAQLWEKFKYTLPVTSCLYCLTSGKSSKSAAHNHKHTHHTLKSHEKESHLFKKDMQVSKFLTHKHQLRFQRDKPYWL